MLTLAELALRLGVRPDDPCGDIALAAMALPHTAGAGDLSFVIAPDSAAAVLSTSAAAAVLTNVSVNDPRVLAVDDVLRGCARASAWLPPRRVLPAAEAIDSTARLGSNVAVGKNVRIGESTTIGAGTVLGDGVSIGAFTTIGPQCNIAGQATIGNRVSVGSGCSIGEDGFAFVRDGRQWLRLPAFGSVVIGDDSVLRAQVIIHAGVFGDTAIGARCALDSQVLIGHDSVLGADTAIAGQTAVAGAARIGSGCRIAGKVGISEGVAIADGVTVTAMSMVTRSLTRPGASYSSGWPAEPSRRWWRRVGAWRRASPAPARAARPGATHTR